MLPSMRSRPALAEYRTAHGAGLEQPAADQAADIVRLNAIECRPPRLLGFPNTCLSGLFVRRGSAMPDGS